MKLRQFWRCYQALGVFAFTSYSADNVVFVQQRSKIQNFNGVNTFSCSKNVFKFHHNRQFSPNFIQTPLTEGQFSGIATLTEASLIKTTEGGNSLLLDNFTNQLFPLNPIPGRQQPSTSKELSFLINNLPLKSSLPILSCLRQILITSTVINVFRKQ